MIKGLSWKPISAAHSFPGYIHSDQNLRPSLGMQLFCSHCPYLVKFLFIQCLGDGKVSRFLEKAFVFLKNVT